MEAGPLHSRLLHMGSGHMQELQRRYIANFGSAGNAPLVVRPNARLLLVRRDSTRAAL
jgi:hypothetical protein